MPNSDVVNPLTMKDLKSSDPRWCTGCGDYTILVGLRKFMVQNQIFYTKLFFFYFLTYYNKIFLYH